MDSRQPAVKYILRRIRRGISIRVHDQRLQTRLQVGSALALSAGLLVTVIVIAGALNSLGARFSDLLFGPPTPGLVDQDRLVQIVLVFLVSLLAGATLPHFRSLSAAGLTIIYFLFYLIYAFGKFNDGILVQPLYPALALLLTFAAVITFRYFAEERRRTFVGWLFRRSVAPDDVDRVLEHYDKDALALRGVRRAATILHVDLREFSNLADGLKPEAAIDFMNQYTALIHGIVFRHAGTVVKNAGNGILAVWNLPLEDVHHARGAVRAAMEIKREAAKLRAKLPKPNGQDAPVKINLGFGIATGEAVAGHIGASTRAEYILMGSVVTIAERLAMKPDRGVYIDRATLEQIGDEFQMREANPVRLRRKTDPMSVWEVFEPKELGADPATLSGEETAPRVEVRESSQEIGKMEQAHL